MNAGMVQNIFMEWVDPNEAGPPPGRTIEITDELRARDAAERAARETRPDWAIKAELRQENLHLVRRPVGPNRVEGRPRVATPRQPQPKKTWPLCACGVRIQWNRTQCPKCTKLSARPKCIGCGEVLRANVIGDRCPTCRVPMPKPPRALKEPKPPAKPKRPDPLPRPVTLPAPVPVARLCACGNRLHPSSTGDQCFSCKGLSKSKEERLARRVKCDNADCSHLLRWPRKSGICGFCSSSKLNRAATTARYRAKRIAEEGSKCSECGKPIRWNSKTGLCAQHAAEQRQCRVIIHATTLEEHKLNQLWASLCLEDKMAVLAESLRST